MPGSYKRIFGGLRDEFDFNLRPEIPEKTITCEELYTGKDSIHPYHHVDPEWVKTLSAILASYGNHPDIEALLKNAKGNKIHRCPQCHGNGYIEEEYNAYPDNLPDSGWVEDIRTRKKTCPLCEGEGWTDVEYVEKTRVVHEAWVPKEEKK